MDSRSTPWRIVLRIGASECVWLGVCMVLSPWYKVAPALFSPINAAYVIPVGVICVIAGIIGLMRPDVMGGGALVLACGLRITQSINVRNVYPVGVWLILIAALILTYARFRHDTDDLILGGRNITALITALDRGGIQQSEERERQTREGERQTAEAERQTRESARQTSEGERLRSVRVREGVRQTSEGDRQTVEGDRQTREGERQTAEGEHLADLRIKLDNETKEQR